MCKFNNSMNIVLFLIVAICNVCACIGCSSSGPYCIILNWAPWSKCNATCCSGIIRREKYICCNMHKYNSLYGCLHGCNITEQWWQNNAVQSKSCGKCLRHGKFNSTLKRCVCNRSFGGPCCNGEFYSTLQL